MNAFEETVVVNFLDQLIDHTNRNIQYTTSRTSKEYIRNGRTDEGASDRWIFIEAAPHNRLQKVMLGMKHGKWHVTWGKRHTPDGYNRAKFVSTKKIEETFDNFFDAAEKFEKVYNAIVLTGDKI